MVSDKYNAIKVEEVVLERSKQDTLNSFKQGHIISIYSMMNDEERNKVMKQLELLHFDVLDLVGLPRARCTTI